jgi:cytochrome c-type biogenesis protein
MGPESYGLGLIAGMLSILSPCVLPLLPIVFGTASDKHKYGPLVLAAGLTVSFVLVGLFVATIGYSIGLDAEWIRKAGGIMLAAVGIILLVPALSAGFAMVTAPASRWLDSRLGSSSGPAGLTGQFSMGVVLGTVWSPCIGPTLGAASLLAAQGENLGQVTLVMIAFAIGAAIPLTFIGMASRATLARWRGKMLQAGSIGKMLLGGVMLAVGVMIISGVDKAIEAWAVEHSPAWLTWLTTSV